MRRVFLITRGILVLSLTGFTIAELCLGAIYRSHSKAGPHEETIVALIERNNNVIYQAELNSEVSRRVKVERIPAANVLYLPVTGSYSQHPKVLTQLMAYAEETYALAGTCIGIYPVDPDAVGVPFSKEHEVAAQSDKTIALSGNAHRGNEARLIWEVAIRVIPGEPHKATMEMSGEDPFHVAASKRDLQAPLSRLKKPRSPFRLKQLPEVTALTLESVVARSARDGLALNAWMIENGYVQIAATRMELAMMIAEPGKIKAKIMIPVERRKSGLKLR